MTTGKLTMAMTATPTNPRCGETLSLAFTVTNATKYMIDVTSLKYTLQPGGLPLSLANNFNSVTIQCPKGWSARQNGGIFTMTPDTPADGKVGPTGLEFDINDITVNNSPGTSDVKMEQVGPDKTHYETPASLNKTWPPLAITAFYANPHNSVEYGGNPQLVWEASLGAVIALEYNGKVIRNVKNEPSQPLPSSGSYDIDDPLYQSTVFTLVAASGPGALENGQLTAQTTVSILPPSVDLDGQVTPGTTAPPTADLTWTTTSATAATLTAAPGPGVQTAPLASTGDSFPLLVETDYTLSATNPATVAPTTSQTTLTPPPFDWVQVGPGPDPSPTYKQSLHETHADLAVLVRSDTSAECLFLSPDGINWSPCPSYPLAQSSNMVFMAHTDGATYLSGIASGGGKPAIYVTTDFATWTPVPLAADMLTGLAGAICVDDGGTLYAYMILSLQLWKLPAGAADWTLVGPLDAYGANLQWMAGQLWTFSLNIGEGPTNTISCMRSADGGATWTTTTGPQVGDGHCSMVNAVHNNEICMLYTNDINTPQAPQVPFQLLRVDQNGTFSLDPPTPGVCINPNTGAPSVASFGGTLFTSGQNAFTPNSGIWARNT